MNEKFSMLAADVYCRKYWQRIVRLADDVQFPDKLNELLNMTNMKIETDTIELIEIIRIFSTKGQISHV